MPDYLVAAHSENRVKGPVRFHRVSMKTAADIFECYSFQGSCIRLAQKGAHGKVIGQHNIII